jgi:YbgC/YbaW family acyl-CoA thioester hydrolase
MNYANYLKFYEVGHLTFLTFKGLGFKELQERYGLRTYVRHITVDYIRELHKGDEVVINTSLLKIGTTSMTYKQSILKKDLICSTAEITVVFTDVSGKSHPIPESLKSRLLGLVN